MQRDDGRQPQRIRTVAQHFLGDEMMTQAATCAFFGGDRPIHYSTLYRGIIAGRYPKPVRVGPNTSRWLRSECQKALETLIAERDGSNEPEAA